MRAMTVNIYRAVSAEPDDVTDQSETVLLLQICTGHCSFTFL